MTASQLARKSGVSKSVLSDWLGGAKPRDIEQVRKVAVVFGTTLDHLCFGEGTGNGGNSRSATGSSVLDEVFDDGWIGGLFEIRIRRVKKPGK